jgi:hypothetical protein
VTAFFAGMAAHGQEIHTVHAGVPVWHTGLKMPLQVPGMNGFEDGGVISENLNEKIIVDWGITPGIFEIKVVETTIFGCMGDTVYPW